jgi:hypothetical protein
MQLGSSVSFLIYRCIPSPILPSIVDDVYLHCPESLGTCRLFLVQSVVFLCCLVLNSASELISLSGVQCALFKNKFHMNITVKSFHLHLFLDFFLHFTHQHQTVHAKCDIFVFVVCSSYPLFNLFSCSVRRIKARQKKSDDNECP